MTDSLNCRTCFSTEFLCTIFQQPEKCRQYSDLLYLVTGLKIQINDSMPQVMCKTCINFVNQSVEFRITCLRTFEKFNQKNLRHVNTNSDEAMNVDSDDSNVDYDDETDEKNIKKYDELLETRTHFFLKNEISDINKHENQENDDDLKKRQSEFSLSIKEEIDKNDECELSSDINTKINNCTTIKNEKNTEKSHTTDEEHSKNSLHHEHSENHLAKLIKIEKTFEEVLQKDQDIVFVDLEVSQTKRRKEIEKGEEEKGYNIEGAFKCFICNKKFENLQALKEHKRKFHPARCKHCGQSFVNDERLLVHCRGRHGYERIDRCTYCEYRGVNARATKVHERRIHAGRLT